MMELSSKLDSIAESLYAEDSAESVFGVTSPRGGTGRISYCYQDENLESEGYTLLSVIAVQIPITAVDTAPTIIGEELLDLADGQWNCAIRFGKVAVKQNFFVFTISAWEQKPINI